MAVDNLELLTTNDWFEDKDALRVQFCNAAMLHNRQNVVDLIQELDVTAKILFVRHLFALVSSICGELP